MEVFVVRMWPERPTLRGRVEHVQSGDARSFESREGLLEFIDAHVAEEPPVARRSEPPA